MSKKKEKIPDIQGELIDQLIRESGGPQALFDKGGLLDMLKKRLIEKALEAEMDDHLGYAKHTPIVPNSGNSRNGHGSKSIIVDNDQFDISPPQDVSPKNCATWHYKFLINKVVAYFNGCLILFVLPEQLNLSIP